MNEGPRDLSLSANSVAEHASPGTVVGTVSGADPDAGDTKTYSLSDNAGGRFAINASTGVITVADGAVLNYEAAASHNLTVQVTDSAGQSYTEQFTINLTNVNEGPTDIDSGDGGEPMLVASLFQGSAAGPETVQPFILSLATDSDAGSKLDVDEPRNPVEWSSQSVGVDILDSGRNRLNILSGGDAKPVDGVGRKGSSSTSSGQQDATAVNPDSVEGARPEDGQVPWPPTEGMQPVPDNAGDLAMPMVAGLVGAALQGSMRKKEKLMTLHGNIPPGEIQTSNENTAEDSGQADKEAPPRAA